MLSRTIQAREQFKYYGCQSINNCNFVPLTGVWIDIDTQQGISQLTYEFILICDNALTLHSRTHKN